jgi:hypothetical protein
MTPGLQFWISVAALVISPLLAVQASRIIERGKEKRARQLSVFKTLMQTRASGLAPDHVQALNRIDVEFYVRPGVRRRLDKKSQAVLRAWKAYLDHLNVENPDASAWITRKEDLFVDLLFAMGQCLGYDFDKTDIRRTSYFPRGHGEIELDQLRIRKGFADVVEGRKGLPVYVVQPPAPPPPPEQPSSARPTTALPPLPPKS